MNDWLFIKVAHVVNKKWILWTEKQNLDKAIVFEKPASTTIECDNCC